MPCVPARRRQFLSGEDQYGPAHAYLPPSNTYASVAAAPRMKRVGDTFVSRVFGESVKRLLQPAQDRPMLRTARQRVPVLAVPVVMRLAEALGVVRASAGAYGARSLHQPTIPNGIACCHLAALLNLGVPV
jgi:hypothetical protein